MFYKEILEGFTELPVSGAPGVMVITSEKAQPVFTGENPADVFLAAAEYGNGRVFVTSHDCYLNWLRDKVSGLEGDFMNSVKKWLTRGAALEDSEVVNAAALKDDSDLSSVKLVYWWGGVNFSPELMEKVKEFVQSGGGLLCSLTPWGHVANGKKTMNDIVMYHFLKDNFGIVLTDKYFGIPKRVSVDKNRASIGSFDGAVKSICCDARKIPTFCNTIDCGVDNLRRCGLQVDPQQMEKMKDSLLQQCEANGWNPFPSKANAVKDEVRNITRLLCRCYMESGEKAPKIEDFPFDFDEVPPLITSVESNLKTVFSERLSTGYYLPAGVEMHVKVSNGNFKGWSCRVGAHTDVLKDHDKFCRWPVLVVSKTVTEEFTLRSPFGGLVYFDSPKNGGELVVVISNVVETPYFDATRPEFNDWQVAREKPGLWAELAGEHIVFTCPAKYVRQLEDAKAITDYWDDVIRQHHLCRGTNPNEQKRERVVCDLQCGAGYMHSGYPVVTHLDVSEPGNKRCLFNIELMKTHGNWGLFHELGHNMQRGEWTFDGCGEVTVNIFSMHAMEKCVGLGITETEFVRDRKREFAKFFKNKPTYSQWKDECCMALMTFAQLVRHFGWQPMYDFMKEYENDMKNNKNALPKNNQEKIDQWVTRYSRLIGFNIRPQFEMWGLPVSDSVDEHVASLPAFCPEEEKDAEVFFSKK